MRPSKVWIAALLAVALGTHARGQPGDGGVPFGGFFYEDQRADGDATHVRFSYRVRSSPGFVTVSGEFPLEGRRKTWHPNVADVIRVEVLPLKAGAAVGNAIVAFAEERIRKPPKDQQEPLLVMSVHAFTRGTAAAPVNVRTWFATRDPKLEGLRGAPTGFDDFYYTDHSPSAAKVKWKLFKRKAPPNQNQFEKTGEDEYVSPARPGPELWSFVHDHTMDGKKPTDVARVEVTVLDSADTPIGPTVIVTNPIVTATWSATWFETQPDVPLPSTAMILSDPP